MVKIATSGYPTNPDFPLYIRGVPNEASGLIPLFVAAPHSGFITSDTSGGGIPSGVALFTVGSSGFPVDNSMPLFVAGGGESGAFSLTITGQSEMLPKGWRYLRQAGRDTSGYIPIGSGITIFVNGE
jgi:hypothetical protein